ncbi:MAG: C10 family peptidase [Bacteroidales bacterium]|jgi:hypothetical protein|nr:C10 family peptidase [Bacteroidales bacterium]
MKKLNVFLLVTILVGLSGCSKDENLNDGQSVATDEVQLTGAEWDVVYRMRNENNRVSIEEATQFANDVIGFLDGESAVKSGTARSISSIGALVSKGMQTVALKSSDGTNVEIPDTVAYIFNFGDEEGYAIVSADTRIEDPILAYTGGGKLLDTIDNPGVILFLEGTEDYVVHSIVEAEQKRDSLIGSIIDKLNGENESETKAINPRDYLLDEQSFRVTTTGTWSTISRVYPLSPVEWGQGNNNNEPFWRNVRYKNCTAGTSPAGCVAVAIAHIMSYWKYPASINGKNFNWTELNRYTGDVSSIRLNNYKTWNWTDRISAAPSAIQTQAANLMENIGSKIGMKYSCGVSEANTANAVSYLRTIGYQGGGSGIEYNYNTIVASLDKNQPVIIRGDSYKTTKKYLWGLITSSSYSNGHAWVIDGYLNRRQTVTTTVELILRGKVTGRSTSITYNYSNYLHHNWGWHGTDNGYYVSGSFDSNATAVASDTKSGEEGNFQYEVKIFPYISR